jgi:hypothetical protein
MSHVQLAYQLEGIMPDSAPTRTGLLSLARRSFIGGSDARIIMGEDEPALLRLWREKRGEVEPEDLSRPQATSIDIDRRLAIWAHS